MTLFSALDSFNSEPITFEEDVKHKEYTLWKEVIKDEMSSLIKKIKHGLLLIGQIIRK